MKHITIGIADSHFPFFMKLINSLSSKNKGKSGGSRLITYYLESDSEVYLLSIYDKSEQANIFDAKIIELVNIIPL